MPCSSAPEPGGLRILVDRRTITQVAQRLVCWDRNGTGEHQLIQLVTGGPRLAFRVVGTTCPGKGPLVLKPGGAVLPCNTTGDPLTVNPGPGDVEGIDPNTCVEPPPENPPPTDLAVEGSPTPTSITVEWNPPAGATPTGYRVEYRVKTPPGSWNSQPAGVGETSADITGLAPGTEYEVRVIALYAVGESAPAGPITVSTAPAPTPPPTGLAVQGSPGATSVTLTWNAPVGGSPTGYRFEYREVGAPSWTSEDVSTSPLLKAVTGLSPGVTYEFRVAALYGASVSSYDGPVQATTTAPPPTGLNVTSTAATQVSLAWTAPAGATPTGYRFEYRQVGAGSWTSEDVAASPTTKTVTGLTPGIQYEFRVAALYGTVVSAFDGPVSTTTTLPPPTGLSLNVTPMTTSFQVTWLAPTGGLQTGYLLEWRVNTPPGAWTPVDLGPGVTLHEVTGLTAGTQYDVRVSAKYAAGNSAPDGPITVKTATEFTLWNGTGGNNNADNNDPVSLGTKFRVNQSAWVLGIRYYRGTASTGVKVGQIVTATGCTVVTDPVSFTDSGTGWQEARFATPVLLVSGTLYMARVFFPIGQPAFTGSYWTTGGPGASGIGSGTPLFAPNTTEAVGQGVFRAGATVQCPDQSFQATNYWIEPIIAAVV